jgi:hypothetical protein
MNKIIPLFLLAMVMACNKKAENVLGDVEYKNDIGLLPGTPKVLYLVIDGARGLSIRDIKPPTIWKMRDSAVYTWNGIGDSATVDGGNWATMLTGVRAAKHGVVDDNYSQGKLDQYPVFFQRIKESKPGMRTAAITASADLSTKLIGNTVTENKFAGSDAAAKDAIIAELQKDDASVVLGQLKGVAEAGAQFGYDASVPEYTAAILKADGYVKEIMNALYARKTYQHERWLVVLTSSRGGAWQQDPEDSTAMGNPKMNTFTLFFNSRFQSKVIVKPQDLKVPYEGKTVRLTGDNATSAIRGRCVDNALGDIGALQGMTIELKMKMNRGPNNNYRYGYPPFLSKTKDRTGSTAGWAFFRSNQGAVFYFADGAINQQLLNNTERGGKDTDNGEWHTYTGVIERSGSMYKMSFLIDGANKVTATLASSKDIFAPEGPLTVGFNPSNFGNALDAYITDVKIWNVAIPDDVIREWAPRTYINKEHFYYNNLIAYWPCMDGNGNRFRDYGPSKKDLLIGGAFQWASFSDLSNFLLPGIADGTRYVPNTFDIPYQILEWLGIRREDSWGLDGHTWPAEFRDYPLYGGN